MVARSKISEEDAIFIGTVLEGFFFGMSHPPCILAVSHSTLTGIFVVLYGLFRWIRTKQPGRDYFTGSITLLIALCTLYFSIDLCQQYLTLVCGTNGPERDPELNSTRRCQMPQTRKQRTSSTLVPVCSTRSLIASPRWSWCVHCAARYPSVPLIRNNDRYTAATSSGTAEFMSSLCLRSCRWQL